MDNKQALDMGLEMANLSAKCVTEVCRIADKYAEDRNAAVLQFATTQLHMTTLTDFDDWEVPVCLNG